MTGCPAPEPSEAFTTPAEQGGGLHGDEGLTPIQPARQHHESHTGGMGGAPWFDTSFAVEGQLFAREEVFNRKGRGRVRIETDITQGIGQKGCQEVLSQAAQRVSVRPSRDRH